MAVGILKNRVFSGPFIPAIHVLMIDQQESRRWPGQAGHDGNGFILKQLDRPPEILNAFPVRLSGHASTLPS
ncbi:MAG TPA: hypothetical protein VHC94_16890 [Nitrobacter sp.]|jgi:hypothetical protein|nr:hypothetical protein [Nitrobacter sp.]